MKLIEKILTHLHPHLDEFLAELIMKMFGLHLFHIPSNVKHEEICVASEEVGSISKNHPTWFCNGIGGGPFDDHGLKLKKSASLLVAEYLGIEHDPRLTVLVELVTQHDKQKSTSPDQFTLPRAINFMHRYGYQSELVREWVEQGLRGIIDSEALLLERIKSEIGKMASREAFQTELKARFLNETREWEHFNLKAISNTLGDKGAKWLEFAEGAFEKQKKAFMQALSVAEKSVQYIQTRFGQIQVLSIDASNGIHKDYEIEFDACSRHGRVRADLILMKNSMGHVLIAINPGFKGNLTGLVKVLRSKEASKRGLQIPQEYIICEGSIPVEGLTSWYVHEGIGYRRIYCGTLTRTIVDPSECSFEEIQEITFDWLGVGKFTAMPSQKGLSASLENAFQKAADAS